ncbi:unnamed protein product, partial [marine sediment metagenome]
LSEEGKIKRIISRGEKAIERRDLATCISFISAQYLDSFGNDRRSLIFLGEKIFKQYQDIFIHIESLSVELKGGLAEVKFIARVMVSRPGETGKCLSVEKGSERFMVTFRKEEGKWKVYRAEIPEYRFD